VYPEVKEAIIPYLTEFWGNPSSGHWAGEAPKIAM
jgi:cysteine sulfinate desulfinase/cysteine desulfurase-like protein